MCSLNMGGSLYKGLAVVKCNTVDNANEEVGDNDPPPEWKVGVVASPMENLLMHADILYSKPVERGKPAVVLNQIVTRIIAGAATYIDPNADAKGWTGEELKAPK